MLFLVHTFAHSVAVCRVFVDDDLLHQLVVAQFPHRRLHLWALERTPPRLLNTGRWIIKIYYITLKCVSYLDINNVDLSTNSEYYFLHSDPVCTGSSCVYYIGYQTLIHVSPQLRLFFIMFLVLALLWRISTWNWERN